ncbi:MAG: hypothetical protein GX986_10445 [Firmicutes bacterium]|nr:hypothetical protein [Bacillota bacterium]
MYLVIRLRRSVLLLTMAAFMIGCLSTVGYAFVTSYLASDTIALGVSVASVNVGGLSAREASAYLGNYLRAITDSPVTIVYGNARWEVIPSQIGITTDLDNILISAFQVGRQGHLLRRLSDHVQSHAQGWDVPHIVSVDHEKLTSALRKIALTANVPPIDASIRITSDDQVEIIPGSLGQKVELNQLVNEVITASTRQGDRTVTVIPQIVMPDFSTEDAYALQIRRPIAQFATIFDPKDGNRVGNIRLAAQELDGVLLRSGEIFSFNQWVGPRVDSEGYKAAPVIFDGQLLPGIGGGVCQVSTTLYNAVLLAGLDVITRSPHSLPIGYVPLGRDAAVAYDYLDLVFRNNSPYGLILSTRVEHDRLIIKVFSDAPLERSIELDSNIVRVLEPGVIRHLDPSLLPGTVIEDRKGRQGYEVQLWRIIKIGDKVVHRELVEKSIYKPQDRLIRQGMTPESADN